MTSERDELRLIKLIDMKEERETEVKERKEGDVGCGISNGLSWSRDA